MTKDEALSLFTLAGFTVKDIHKLFNGYWPDCTDYAEEIRKNPWWLIITPDGEWIKVGWRKRVIEINWAGTKFRGSVTKNPVTQTDSLVHAYTSAKAVEYLTTLRLGLDEMKFNETASTSGEVREKKYEPPEQ